MKTFSLRKEDVNKKWVLIDAEDLILGRTASIIANILRGKNKPEYTPHTDCGDYVIVVNAEKIAMTGNSKKDEKFYWHTGFMGGIKHRTRQQLLDGKYPERVLLNAVKRMMPGGALSNKQLTHLRLFNGPEHAHAAQNPEKLDIAGMNSKNIRRAS
jgi:large subunit ribosomal protein L13